MRKLLTGAIVISFLLFGEQGFASVYFLPGGTDRLVGKNLEITVPADSKFPLEHFAAQFKIGISNLLEANPGVDVYLPSPGMKIVVPSQLILPETPRTGIVVNSAEMRLYFYPPSADRVVVLPIGIGEVGKDTPYDWKTFVRRKKYRPTWIPTEDVRIEHAARGEILPRVFPAGTENPMGLHALYVGDAYAIHGTNVNFGIGLRVSHGCVRLRNEDIKDLFDQVSVGTPVRFINEPIKMTTESDGSCYLEVHNPLSVTPEQFNSGKILPLTVSDEMRRSLSGFDDHQVDEALRRRSGIPAKIDRSDVPTRGNEVETSEDTRNET